MADRQFRPGTRDKRYTEGRLSDERAVWVETYIGQFAIMRYDKPWETDAQETIQEEGPTVRLMIPQRRGRSLLFNFTALTHEELVQVRRFFDMLFEMAEPIVIQRDKAAQDAYDRGDDSFTRIHRSVPRLIVRKRPVSDDGEGVRRGPEEVSGGGGSSGDQAVRVQGYSGELVDGEPQEDGSEDDDPQAD